MRYKRPSELNFVACSTISIFFLYEHKCIYSEHMFVYVLFFYRTRTPLIRVTYFSDFVNRFLKNIFEKILQKSIAIYRDVCYN